MSCRLQIGRLPRPRYWSSRLFATLSESTTSSPLSALVPLRGSLYDKDRNANSSAAFEKIYRGRPITVTETRFWRIVDGMKVYKPVTPGLRHRKHAVRHHLWPGRPVLHLTKKKTQNGGRNVTGRITSRHRGGGLARRLRNVDFMRTVPGAQRVVRLEYDPNRSADLALLQHMCTGELSYVIAPDGVNPGDIIYSFRSTQGSESSALSSGLSRAQILQKGNVLMLKDIPIGTQIHNITMKVDGKMQLCRSAGAFATVVTNVPSASFEASIPQRPNTLEYQHESKRQFLRRRRMEGMRDYVQVKLKSGEIRLLPPTAYATLGVVSNLKHQYTSLGKAGASRWRGIRPRVRGIAMCPVDHPHGGGYKSKGNKAPRSPWGWKTKGWKTVRYRKDHIVTPRKRR